MKAMMMVTLIVGLTSCAPPAPPEEGHWAKIRTFLKEYDVEAQTPEARKAVSEAGDKYLKSLSAEQLIVAGRQCARELQRAIDTGRPSAGEGVIGFGFFSQYYPPAADDLRDIGSIRQEIQDKTQPPVWRSELIGMLLGRRWDAKLTSIQRQQVFDCVERILNDKTDSIYIRERIPTRLARILSKMHKEYVDAARNAPPHQQAGRQKTLREFTERVGRYVENSLKWFSDPTTPLRLRGRLLAGARICYRDGVPGSGGVKDVVVQAFTDYQDYPESLWPELARYAMEDFQVPNANEILEQMIRHTSDDSIKRRLQFQ